MQAVINQYTVDDELRPTSTFKHWISPYYVEGIINEIIEFDKKLNDSDSLKSLEVEADKIRNVNLSLLIEK